MLRKPGQGEARATSILRQAIPGATGVPPENLPAVRRRCPREVPAEDRRVVLGTRAPAPSSLQTGRDALWGCRAQGKETPSLAAQKAAA